MAKVTYAESEVEDSEDEQAPRKNGRRGKPKKALGKGEKKKASRAYNSDSEEFELDLNSQDDDDDEDDDDESFKGGTEDDLLSSAKKPASKKVSSAKKPAFKKVCIVLFRLILQNLCMLCSLFASYLHSIGIIFCKETC